MSTPASPSAPTLPAGTLTISAGAAAKVRALLEAQQKPLSEYALRVGIQAGGCSGLSYLFNLELPRPSDLVFERDGIRVVCDPKSILYLSGSELDYVDSLQGAGFSWRNPNVKTTCGCGTSFNI